MLRARRFILGGGGLLQESSGPWNHLYYLSMVILAKLLGSRTEARALGVDPANRWFNRLWTRLTFNHFVDFVSVRDSDSQLALEICGVTIRIARVPDLVFQLPSPPPSEQKDRLALAVAPWRARPGWEQDLALLCDRLAPALKVSVELLCFFPAEDEIVAEKAAALADPPLRVRRWEEPDNLRLWMAEYDLVVGMRYHALALAALAEKPFVGWGFQRKVRSICRDFGQPLWSFERGWEADAVFRQVCEAWRHRDILPHRYRPRLAQLRSPAPTLHEVPRIFPSQV